MYEKARVFSPYMLNTPRNLFRNNQILSFILKEGNQEKVPIKTISATPVPITLVD